MHPHQYLILLSPVLQIVVSFLRMGTESVALVEMSTSARGVNPVPPVSTDDLKHLEISANPVNALEILM